MADINSDNQIEIIILSYYQDNNGNRAQKVFVFDTAGQMLPDWEEGIEVNSDFRYGNHIAIANIDILYQPLPADSMVALAPADSKATVPVDKLSVL